MCVNPDHLELLFECQKVCNIRWKSMAVCYSRFLVYR